MVLEALPDATDEVALVRLPLPVLEVCAKDAALEAETAELEGCDEEGPLEVPPSDCPADEPPADAVVPEPTELDGAPEDEEPPGTITTPASPVSGRGAHAAARRATAAIPATTGFRTSSAPLAPWVGIISVSVDRAQRIGTV